MIEKFYCEPGELIRHMQSVADEVDAPIYQNNWGAYSQWIPVEERLPDDRVRVMAWDRREQSWRIAYIDSIWHMVGFDDDTPICVSHWMPLPEPPEVK